MSDRITRLWVRGRIARSLRGRPYDALSIAVAYGDESLIDKCYQTLVRNEQKRYGPLRDFVPDFPLGLIERTVETNRPELANELVKKYIIPAIDQYGLGDLLDLAKTLENETIFQYCRTKISGLLEDRAAECRKVSEFYSERAQRLSRARADSHTITSTSDADELLERAVNPLDGSSHFTYLLDDFYKDDFQDILDEGKA